MRKRSWIGSAAAAMVFGVGSAAWAAAGDAQVLNVGGVAGSGGTIKGVIKFDGRMANRRPIRMDQDPFCKTHNDAKPALDEKFVFGAGGEAILQNVVVYVSKGLEGKDLPKSDAKPHLDQVGCVYVPHVLAMQTGELKILNGDNTLHNVKMTSANNGSFNEGMPVKDMELTKSFTKPEMGIQFKCDVHPWMGAFLHVFEHPYFAVTQADGTFTIQGLPAGEYEISVWHEFDKFTPDAASKPVKVEDGGEASVEFTYRPPGS